MNILNSCHHCVKSICIRSFSSPYFPTFGLVSLRVQSKCGKIRTRITPNTDTFHSLQNIVLWWLFCANTYFIYKSFKWVSLNIFLWTQLNLNLEKREGWILIFEILTKYARIERIIPSVSLFETFTSNRPFISNYHQSIRQYDIINILLMTDMNV